MFSNSRATIDFFIKTRLPPPPPYDGRHDPKNRNPARCINRRDPELQLYPAASMCVRAVGTYYSLRRDRKIHPNDNGFPPTASVCSQPSDNRPCTCCGFLRYEIPKEILNVESDESI